MDGKTVFLIILGMTVVTYLPRVLPLWVLPGRDLPRTVTIWLRYIPAAVLAALLFPSVLFFEGNRLDFTLRNVYFWSSLPTLVVAYKTRSMFVAVVVGMLTVALLRWIIG